METRLIDAPKPKSFGGLGNAREIDNFASGSARPFVGAIVMAESLADTLVRGSPRPSRMRKGCKTRKNEGEKTLRIKAHPNTNQFKGKEKYKAKEGSRNFKKPSIHNKLCFICDGLIGQKLSPDEGVVCNFRKSPSNLG